MAADDDVVEASQFWGVGGGGHGCLLGLGVMGEASMGVGGMRQGLLWVGVGCGRRGAKLGARCRGTGWDSGTWDSERWHWAVLALPGRGCPAAWMGGMGKDCFHAK